MKALLYDATLCIGCKQCEQACASENHLAYDDKVAAQETTSAYKYTAVVQRGEAYMRRICMHCEDPTCASVCPVGALTKTALGPVTYDGDKCMGCRYCMAACPFGVPKYEWDKLDPRVRKCSLCEKRVSAGGVTACTEACPTAATKFGDRDALLAEAHERIKAEPGKYQPVVFGEHEVGGTSVLMLSGAPFATFDMRTSFNEELPILTYRVLSRIPDFVGLGTVLLAGTWWITKRREEVAAAEEKEKTHED
ncbi:MAG TPA: 4Fe-4S dicluster domain-containing protein [Terriglobales bacterium]|nr:4Fe-4S dicluster domain-containing protein [Terriglobales bacterium]